MKRFLEDEFVSEKNGKDDGNRKNDDEEEFLAVDDDDNNLSIQVSKKPQFANFSVMSLLGRKSPIKGKESPEEKEEEETNDKEEGTDEPEHDRSMLPFFHPPLHGYPPPPPSLDTSRLAFFPPVHLLSPFSLRRFPFHPSMLRQVSQQKLTKSFMLFICRLVRFSHILATSVIKYFTLHMV